MGRVCNPAAPPVTILPLCVTSDDGFPGRVLVLNINEDGTFRCDDCDDVPAGKYDLFVTVKDAQGPLDGPDIGRASRTLIVPPPDAGAAGKPYDVGRIELEALPQPSASRN